MTNWFKPPMRFAGFVALIGWMLTVGLLNPADALAAPSRSSTPSTHGQVAESGVQPLCAGYVIANPSSQNAHVNVETGITVSWGCQGPVNVAVKVDWGDGVIDDPSYNCVSNCVTGSETSNHVYTRTGSFTVTITMEGNASGSTQATVNVS